MKFFVRKTLLFFAVALCCTGCSVVNKPRAEDVGIDRIFDAARVLNGVAVVSDIVPAPSLSNAHQVFLKLENQQPVGAFKLRGAYYMMSRLSPEERQKGVVTCSAGNHAQGVGFAADAFHIAATIFLPKSAPQKKIDAVRAYKNVQAVLVEGSFDDARREAETFQKKSGAIYVPPFDDADVIAGQGTIGWEIMHQLPRVDAVVVPVGGGGLISGVATAVKALDPRCKIIGVQSEAAAVMAKSLEKGELVTLDNVSTLADGTAVRRAGELPYAICKKRVDEIVTVSENDVKEAIRRLYRDCNVTAEGAGALPVAALIAGKIPGENRTVVCIVSGGNIDPGTLRSIVEK